MNKENVNKQEYNCRSNDWVFAEDGNAIYKNPETKEHYTKAEVNEFVYDLIPDEDPESPFDWIDECIHFGLYHRRYNFTRNNENMDADAFQDFVAKHIDDPEYVFLPVYMFEHGGIAFSFGSFNDRFDSGKLGYIWAKLSDLLNIYAVDDRDEAIGCLKNSVEDVFSYWSGDVWLVRITDASGDRVIAKSDESLFGYDYAKQEAELMLAEVKGTIPVQEELVLD